MNDQRLMGPILVTGASRSGTNLMQSLLNRHPNVVLSGETHYFDDLRLRMPQPEARSLTDSERTICEDYFLALSHRPYGYSGVPGQGTMSRSELRNAVGEKAQCADQYFVAYCQLNARKGGASMWGEKTPRHIFRIDDIMGVFPRAKVIIMVRDPRAVVASYRDWKNQGGFDLDLDPQLAQSIEKDQRRAKRSYNIIIQSMLWKGTTGAAAQAQRTYGTEAVRIVKYEDLVSRPEETVPSLCAWIGQPYDSSLLNVPIVNSSFSEYDKEGGFVASAITRWVKKLSSAEVAVIQNTVGAVLTSVGYESVSVPRHRGRLIWERMKLPFAVGRAMVVNWQRIHNLPEYIWRRLQFSSAAAGSKENDTHLR
jgi:hypothetical protein